MKQVDYAKVDLGAAHNGRVSWRKVFQHGPDRRCIVDRGRRVAVLRVSRALADINYVCVPQERLGFAKGVR